MTLTLPLGTLDSVASLLAAKHGRDLKNFQAMTLTLPLGTLDSVASLLAATHFQENRFNGEIHFLGRDHDFSVNISVFLI
jgi:uncharacterized protein (DUF2384 family)